MSEWFYAEGNRERRGPLPAASIVELFHSRRIAGDTLVWREGATDWRPLSEFYAAPDLVAAAVSEVGQVIGAPTRLVAISAWSHRSRKNVKLPESWE